MLRDVSWLNYVWLPIKITLIDKQNKKQITQI